MLRRITYFCIALLAITAMASHAAMTEKKPRMVKANRAMTPDIGKDGGPNLLSHAALVFDQTTGRPLYAKNADTVTPIASITKLMTAMVVLDAKLPLDEAITIDREDTDTIKGTRSRLPVGTSFLRGDLMRLALMASDNRAAHALGRNYPGGSEAFVEAMNTKAKLLGLESTHFVDPSGLTPDNVSSPQDLAVLVAEAAKYDPIREYSTTHALDVTLPKMRRPIGFSNTNALVKNSDWNIGLSKTGYISESGKCLVMQTMIANQPIVIVLLDSWGKFTRIGDANRIKRWVENNSKVAALASTSSY
jgi:D-alanyl-D-alanine endopeptidase (penicillin-binding protein 7)